ncbi:hypothetical protein [Amycolatopsis oliviviridis]|nr:hypothetical protein [Amycolatopsis oliviviridis]
MSRHPRHFPSLLSHGHDAVCCRYAPNEAERIASKLIALEGMMRLLIDTSKVTFTVGREVQPKTDQNGQQRFERNTNVPMWAVQLVAMDDGGAEVITVTVTGHQPPKVAVGQLVNPVELQAIPWAQNGKNGTAFRASDIKAVAGSKAGSASSS